MMDENAAEAYRDSVSNDIHDGKFDEDVAARFDKLITEEKVVTQVVHLHRTLTRRGAPNKGPADDDLKLAVGQIHHITRGPKTGEWIVTHIQCEYRGLGL